MRIAVLGTRGFPGTQGGVEAHCENLYPKLVKAGCEVAVFTRKPYAKYCPSEFKGVTLIPLTCPKNKFLEAFLHTFKGIFAARKIKPDIIHIHAVGPSLLIPLARCLGFKVIMTNHGPDYERKKWNFLAKTALRWGERAGSIWADDIICISGGIAAAIKRKYNRDAHVIPNGVIIPEAVNTDIMLKKLGLKKERYILAVGRLVPEKGLHDLVEAFGNIKSGLKLVIVGRADHEDRYSLGLKEQARNNPDIILTGFLTGMPLKELYSNAGLFVLPSYYEGLPIVLLEAMSYGLPCVVSDIPANREVGLSEDRFFKPGDIKSLSGKIKEFINKPMSEGEKRSQIKLIAEKYDWTDIAKRTMEVYEKVIAKA